MTTTKKLTFLILSITSFITLQSLPGIIAGQTMLKAIEGIHRTSFRGYTTTVDYTNGGATVNFPAGWFTNTETPSVFIGIQLKNLAYATNQIISAVITASDSNSVTIRVNVNDNGTIAEAATDDVTLFVHAFSE